ncbi:chondroitin sulfate proteoglycan 4-like isoform X1 [Siniperca chuatsi]|uniref:chondroitin sulfate proteoglycan 4-like isoform X1 n=1 Tax=Siniperca chuatsi TaxID=119488 RepID=UPI001CE0444B|nr:chondroitin sulfate proteoglycan 4-like isoform X1 [Siniperca chuatsi]
MGSFVTNLFLLLLIATGQVYGVSFYGDGYIHLRTVEASIQTLLHVRFRTSSQAGLLFLAAGRRDFLLLELISGRLQVRLDMGSGERSLRSEKGIHLSDLAWHSIELTHDHHNVNMTVDRNSHTRLRIPGPDLELSVEDGLFVGGAAGLNHPYLLNISAGFRGCVDEVVFNEHNLLSSLRPYSGYKSVHEVSLGCSPQFSATEEDSVSFFSSKAFISLPPWEVPQEGVFECELHPSAREEDGMILYSSGNQGGFVAIEIRDGHLVATVGNGEGSKTELRSLTHVHSNHTWYPILLHLQPHSVQLKVGEELIKANLNMELQVIQLKGPLFLGGLDEDARGEARRAGLMSAVPGGKLAGGGGSFKGCLRKMRVNTQRTGLPHAAITKDITVGCKTGSRQAPDAVTTTSPTDRPEVDVTTTPPIINNKKNSNFLLLRKLEVAEGGRAPLEPKHMRVNLDFRKLGIHPSQLMFRIEGQPVHGQLRLDLSPDPDGMLDEGQDRTITIGAEEVDRTFSMLDLWQGRVMYVHGGSEDQQDFFMFSVFSSNKKKLPVFLKGNRLHRFDISISPVNDAPVLSLPEGNLFTLVEKSKRPLTTDVLRVSDPDSSPAELVFSSLGNLNTDVGHLEHQDYPGRAINLFCLNDLEEGKISFVHTGVPTSRLALRVSDGQKLSNTVVLRIMAVPLEHKLVNNTGLEVYQGGAAIITTFHLAVQVNVADQTVEIRYDITELPQYGELQRLHSSGDWKPTTSFSQKLLEKERIRYLSTYHGLQNKNNITDHFKCNISIGYLATEEVVFLIMVHLIHFKVTRSKMEVNGVQTAAVTPEDLHVISKGVKLDESDLYFRLLTVPKKGQLFLNNKVLQRNSTFNQKNITDGLVKYELLNRLHDDTRDTFSFQVFSTHASSTTYDFRINIKAESTAITVVNKGLSVLEGGSKVINKDILFTHTASNREVQYSITVSPRHGQIRRINLSNSTSINDNIVTFTNQDIIGERIMYVHDDSETKQDSFTFQIMVYKPHKHTSKKEDRNTAEHTFNISVQLVNDQRPVRVVDKVFHVARDGQRLVTLNDLRYRDDDSNFEDSWLVYTRRGIPMGELVLASDTSHKLYEFTQRDLEQKKVLFVHRGVSFGRFVLFVSDGKHYVSALLEVMAQDPYLQAENNTGLTVQRGGITTLTSANLSVFSNLDIRDPQEVTFKVFLPPKHGVLCFNDADRETVTEADAISIFTQQDLVVGRVAYHHDGSHELSDWFNVTAGAREKSTERRLDRGRREVHLDIGVPVKIYLESHQRPPTVISNHPVVVAEGQNVSISREHLEVVHEDSQPSEIVFTVQSPPTLGFLQRFSPNDKHQNNNGEQQHLYQAIREQATNSFTQEDLNQGLIIYHQQAAGSTNDSVLLEATNGVTKVGPIRLEIDIIPILLPLQVKNVSDLTLDEGSSLPLTSDIIKVANHHFSGMNFLYQVIVPPRNGHLEHSRIPGMPITAFTHTEVEREYISYIHDGSDTQRDNFTIVANQTEIRKHSLPCTVHINIKPVNDETPVVATNKGLKVWVGSVTEITINDLSAEDSDTLSEGLEFIVTPPSNGYLALKSAPSRHILNFTQNHIQTGQLVFVHSGALSGGFHFQVNDGVNFAPRQIFSTSAHSLVLTLQRNHPMEVYPGSVTPISEQELQAVTNDVIDIRRNHSVVFAVTAPPKLGRLVRRMPDNSTLNISTFTQSMVNDGIILYDQNKPESVGWSAADAFSFTVSSPPAFLPPHTFTILISYQANEHHDNPQHKTRLLNNAGAVVAEGGRVMIDRSKLDASNLLGKVPEPHRKDHHILYRVISLPRHGALSIRGHNLTRNQPDFSQVTLNKLGITYIHDDSETTSDSFTFRAWVAPLDLSSSSSSSSLSAFSSDSSSSFSPLYSASSSSLSSLDVISHPRVKDSLAVTETFNITVTPVNDQPPLIRSRTPSMKVVVGERVVLGPDNLQVEDHDTPPEELHYLVISKPNNGYLTLGERPEPVTSFTQYDVNHGRLHFIQQGEPSTGVFYFNVTDGHHRPLYRLFSLEVIKPSVSMVNNTGLSLVQGRTAVVLATNQLAAQTNSRSPANITYTVTTHPRHGRIAINDQEVTTFCHEDLQFGRVVYHMTDLSESEDSFQVSVSASSPDVDYGNVTAQTVKVTVRPLIYLREPVRVPSGIAVKLGKAMIDASELARISRADPVFEVLSSPKHGKLVKMTYDPNRASEVLKSFTFRDVVQGRVAIKETLSDGDNQLHNNKSALATARGHAPATPLNDSFIFLLKAGNVQPAKGELHFTIFPHHQMHHVPSVSNKADGASREHTTTLLPTHNRTTTGGGRGGGRGGSTTRSGIGVGLPPDILLHKNNNKTQHKLRPHSRWGNHTRSGSHGGRSGSSAEGAGGGHSHAPQPHSPSVSDKHGPANPPDIHPVHVEVLPRPASDPLLIILPLLSCLLLIIILVVLILVFRRRKEKQAQLRLLQQLAAVALPTDEGTEGSPYLGRAERSVAMPSVVVTPLGPRSCPNSPRVTISPRRKSLAPGMTFWGPFEADRGGGDRIIRGGNSSERDNVPCGNAVPAVTAGFKTSLRSRSPTPTLKDNQYWV